jgi:hypothetical protein
VKNNLPNGFEIITGKVKPGTFVHKIYVPGNDEKLYSFPQNEDLSFTPHATICNLIAQLQIIEEAKNTIWFAKIASRIRKEFSAGNFDFNWEKGILECALETWADSNWTEDMLKAQHGIYNPQVAYSRFLSDIISSLCYQGKLSLYDKQKNCYIEEIEYTADKTQSYFHYGNDIIAKGYFIKT